MFQFKKRDMMADFGGTQKYFVALDHKNNYREIVYPEYHLSLPKLVNAVIEWSSEEISKYSLNAFSNICTVSPARDKPIVDAFKFFSGRIDALDNDRLLSLRDAVINIGYVEIISSTEEDSYTIFEILNARGLDPEDHELLKNYIMRYLQPVERRDDAKRIWEDIEGTLGSSIKSFFRHYAVHKYNYDSRKHCRLQRMGEVWINCLMILRGSQRITVKLLIRAEIISLNTRFFRFLKQSGSFYFAPYSLH